MMQTIEAIIDEQGRVQLLEPVQLAAACRALVTVLDEPPRTASETALFSEAALAEDWNRPEEDAAWADFSPANESGRIPRRIASIGGRCDRQEKTLRVSLLRAWNRAAVASLPNLWSRFN
ncbi:MAG TPA: hypothetical protein VNH11_10410 [Pirellulales bacterium]|nr:hypothetical protein [Pirellulales bacterium]